MVDIVNIKTEQNGEWALLEAHLPGRPPEPIGILLREMGQDRLHVRVESGWWNIFPQEEDREVWRELADDLEQRASESGASEIFDWLETSASHSLRISPRQTIRILDVEGTLDSLCRQYVFLREDAAQAALIPELPAQSHDRKADEATSERRRRNSRSLLNVRLAVASSATTLTVAAFLSLNSFHSTATAVSKSEPNGLEKRINEPILRVLYSQRADDPSFLNVDLQSEMLSTGRHTQKRDAGRQHRRLRLKSGNVVPRSIKGRIPHYTRTAAAY